MMTRPGDPDPPPTAAVARPPAPRWVLRVVVAVGVALVAIGLYLGGLAAGVAHNGDSVNRLERRLAELCAGTPDPVSCVRQPPAAPTVVVNVPTSSPSSSSATPTAPSSSSRSTATASPSTSTAAGRSVPPSSTTSSAPPSSSPSSSSTSTTRSTILPPITIPRLRQASSSNETFTAELVAGAGVTFVALVAVEILRRRPPR